MKFHNIVCLIIISQIMHMIIAANAPSNPCKPSPCGPNSLCSIKNDQHTKKNKANCTCQTGYLGTPPHCRSNCLMSSECSAEKDCINGKCQNACPGPCGTASNCQVKNHRPVCTCPPKYAGIPYIACKKN